MRWTFGFHKMLGTFWVAAQLAASQEGLSFMSEWVIISISTSYIIKFSIYLCFKIFRATFCFTNPDYRLIRIS
jgi:uncharacterized membrane protein